MPRQREDSKDVKNARELLARARANEKAENRGYAPHMDPVTVDEALDVIRDLLQEIDERDIADFNAACEASERD